MKTVTITLTEFEAVLEAIGAAKVLFHEERGPGYERLCEITEKLYGASVIRIEERYADAAARISVHRLSCEKCGGLLAGVGGHSVGFCPELANLRQTLIDADSELSAIAHGRPPSGKETLLDISHRARDAYESK